MTRKTAQTIEHVNERWARNAKTYYKTKCR